MGSIIVFNKIVSTHLCETLLRGTTVVMREERSAEILVASFISELVNPCVLFETISLIVVNQRSEAGSLKDSILGKHMCHSVLHLNGMV